MAVFRTYLDASGSAIDPRIDALAVSGFIGHEDQWAKFDEEWPAVLKRFGITEFHMKDFAHSVNEFESWKNREPKRRSFIQAISKVINDHTRQPVGATVDLHAYRWFNERFCIEETLGTPYGMASLAALAATMNWKEQNNISEPMLFFFEIGDNEQGDFRKYLRGRIKWDDDDYLVEPIFCRKRWEENGQTRYCLPFQASDFVAYEHAKALTDVIRDGKLDMRKSARELLQHRTWKAINRHVLWNYVKNQKIPQRKPWPVYKVASGPLCYVGLDRPLSGTSGVFNN